MYYKIFDTELYSVTIVGDEDGIRNLSLNTEKNKYPVEVQSDWIESSEFFEREISQIKEYFKGERKEFNMKLNPQGTEYQKKVWSALKSVPYGKTETYKDIAIKIGNENASRAVGMANGRNPIAIVVP